MPNSMIAGGILSISRAKREVMMPIRLSAMLTSVTRVNACLVVALASTGEPAPMAWATMVKAPVDTEIITTPTTIVTI